MLNGAQLQKKTTESPFFPDSDIEVLNGNMQEATMMQEDQLDTTSMMIESEYFDVEQDMTETVDPEGAMTEPMDVEDDIFSVPNQEFSHTEEVKEFISNVQVTSFEGQLRIVEGAPHPSYQAVSRIGWSEWSHSTRVTYEYQIH